MKKDDSSAAQAEREGRARYIMVGGFLGAGKTTSIGRLARWLTDRGERVGLITNDQGSHLVDSEVLRNLGFATEEISGGCFCCRFPSLTEAAEKLTAATRPTVFVAEPVGSCTDLVATVSYPLRRIYGDRFRIAPLSVVIDPRRAMRVLGLAEGASFSEKVVYIYRKQLEEADVIVVNKIDVLKDSERESLVGALTREFPKARCLCVSARTGEGLEAWFALVNSEEQRGRAVMDVDYERYAEGEALLGWFNATVRLSTLESSPFRHDPNGLLTTLAEDIQARLERDSVETAHLKMTLSADGALGGLAAVNVVGGQWVPELSMEMDGPFESGELIVNLRAEGGPELLREVVSEAVASSPGVEARIEHIEHFRPGKPVPTHRMAGPGLDLGGARPTTN